MKRIVLSTLRSRYALLVLGLALSSTAFLVGRASAAQPQMKAALEALQNAEGHLVKATPDKGGHRSRALELVRKAIKQVEKGMEFDREH